MIGRPMEAKFAKAFDRPRQVHMYTYICQYRKSICTHVTVWSGPVRYIGNYWSTPFHKFIECLYWVISRNITKTARKYTVHIRKRCGKHPETSPIWSGTEPNYMLDMSLSIYCNTKQKIKKRTHPVAPDDASFFLLSYSADT